MGYRFGEHRFGEGLYSRWPDWWHDKACQNDTWDDQTCRSPAWVPSAPVKPPWTPTSPASRKPGVVARKKPFVLPVPHG